MTRHSHDDYASAAGPGGFAKIPAGETFVGEVINGLILNVDQIKSDRTGLINGYRILVSTETGKTVSISTGTSIGEVISQGERYTFQYKVSKQGRGYCFKGKPTLLNPSKYPSCDQRSQSSQGSASYRPYR